MQNDAAPGVGTASRCVFGSVCASAVLVPRVARIRLLRGSALLVQRARSVLVALLRDAREQGTDLGLPVAPVPSERADRGELAGLGPTGHGLRVDTEHRGDLSRGE